jgi:predicted amidohydrolase
MEISETFDIALCQYELCGVKSLHVLFEDIESYFNRAGAADMYVLPELFMSDYLEATETDDSVAYLDSEDEDRFHEFLATAANRHQAMIVGGSYNILDDGLVYNRCPIVAPGSNIHTYEKTHLIPEERQRGKQAGEKLPPVIEHGGVGIGIAVCYDIEFPSVVRSLANRGAEVIAVPSWTANEAGYQRVRRCAAARAVENQSYLAHVSTVGTRPDGALTGTGRSAVYAPCDDIVGAHGTQLSLPRDMGAAATCSVDITDLRESRMDADVRPYTDSNQWKSTTMNDETERIGDRNQK